MGPCMDPVLPISSSTPPTIDTRRANPCHLSLRPLLALRSEVSACSLARACARACACVCPAEQTCPNVPPELLEPSASWADKAAFASTQAELAKLFEANFAKYADKASAEVLAQGPAQPAYPVTRELS